MSLRVLSSSSLDAACVRPGPVWAGVSRCSLGCGLFVVVGLLRFSVSWLTEVSQTDSRPIVDWLSTKTDWLTLSSIGGGVVASSTTGISWHGWSTSDAGRINISIPSVSRVVSDRSRQPVAVVGRYHHMHILTTSQYFKSTTTLSGPHHCLPCPRAWNLSLSLPENRNKRLYIVTLSLFLMVNWSSTDRLTDWSTDWLTDCWLTTDLCIHQSPVGRLIDRSGQSANWRKIAIPSGVAGCLRFAIVTDRQNVGTSSQMVNPVQLWNNRRKLTHIQWSWNPQRRQKQGFKNMWPVMA